LIIAAIYVCHHHLQLQFDASVCQCKGLDQSTRNGSFLVARVRAPHRKIVQSGEELEVRAIRIRLVVPEQQVAPTRMLPNERRLADYLSSPLTATALLVSALGLFAFVQYLGMAKEAKLQELLLEGLMFLAVPFIWACIWGLIGRVAVHDARFSFHLSIGSLM